MSELFSSFTINNVEVKNRLVRSATTSYWSTNEGVLTLPILEYYKELAQGGVGLIIKGHSYISEQARAHKRQSGLCNQTHVEKMKELTSIVHKYETKIFAQLNHGGYHSKNDRITASRYRHPKWHSREATESELNRIINNFARSAKLAKEANFDGVQIHAAHGYLISQFLSDIVNKRTDKYGSSLEKRAQLLFDVYDSVRENVGEEFPIGVKINCDDFAAEGGFQVNDCTQVCKWLEEKGIDFIEISGGGPEQVKEIRNQRGRYADSSSPLSKASFAGHAVKIREELDSVPLFLVDGIRTRTTIDSLLRENVVDFVSMSKPFIIEPDLPQKLQAGQKKSACIDCGRCISEKYFAKQMLRCFYLSEI